MCDIVAAYERYVHARLVHQLPATMLGCTPCVTGLAGQLAHAMSQSFEDDDELEQGNEYEEGLSLSTSGNGENSIFSLLTIVLFVFLDVSISCQSQSRVANLPGAAFSALSSSICPVDAQQLVAMASGDYRWDEFGFKVRFVHVDSVAISCAQVEDGDDLPLATPAQSVENPQQRLRWIAYLEFSHNNSVEDLTWDKIDLMLPRFAAKEFR